MHEYAITQNILNIAVETARSANAARISEIRLVVGELSTVVDESVQMYFDLLSSGTEAEGALLKFRKISMELQCRNCLKRFAKPKSGFECPVCGGHGYPTEIGREFYIESIEVE